MLARTVSLALATALSLSLFACSSSTGGDEPSESEDAALSGASTECGRAKYNEALGYYRKAVDGANLRTRQEMCDWTSDDAYLTSIADNAMKAVNSCAAFKKVIKTSRYANNVRTALQDTLTFRILTGDLDPTTFQDLSTALVGVTLEGGMGHSDVWSLAFLANGQGTLYTHEIAADGNDVWNEKAITWSVDQRGGRTFVAISPRGAAAPAVESIHYDYLFEYDVVEGQTRISLERQGDSNDAFPATQRFYDVRGECGG